MAITRMFKANVSFQFSVKPTTNNYRQLGLDDHLARFTLSIVSVNGHRDVKVSLLILLTNQWLTLTTCLEQPTIV